MITLKADNRVLTTNTEFTYFSDNYNSSEIDFVVSNINSLSINDYILVGEFGSETTEILKISSITSATKTIRTNAATFAHPESTKITVIPYNQVKFFHSTDPADTSPIAISGFLDIEADDFYTKYQDPTNTSGYGFFIFYNSTTLKASAYSNPIPYAGFAPNTVSATLDAFFSLLNNKEQKLITITDAMRWMNEGYSLARGQLGLVSESYTVPVPADISIIGGTSEYNLPDDFSRLVSITNDSSESIDKIDIKDLETYSDTTTKYYIRNKKIGFVPEPTSTVTYKLYYKGKTELLNSLDDLVDFPNNEFYFLVDFMMYRAGPKLAKPNCGEFFKMFQERINIMKITSHKQDNALDSFGIQGSANV